MQQCTTVSGVYMEVAVSETDGGMHNNSQNVVSRDLWLILICMIAILAILVDGTHTH